MLKRFRLGRKNDSEKPGTPPQSPGGGGQTPTLATGGSGTRSDSAEGFLCPICMKNCKSPEELQKHFEAEHDEQTESPPAQEPQGFVCPICMAMLPSGEALQHHFDQLHDDPASYPTDSQVASLTSVGFLCPQCKTALPSAEALQAHFSEFHESGNSDHTSANRDGDVLALRQEIDDLKTTLKEEKWYSTELRKEVGKLQGSDPQSNDSMMGDGDKMELELFRQQLKASEESRVLLSSEVALMRQQLGEAITVNTNIQDAKTAIEQKAAKLAGDIVGAKAKVDEMEGQQAGMENFIRTLQEQVSEKTRYASSLESQLAQRPGADDVIVLRQELIHAQTLMDQMTQSREKEKETLEKEHVLLQQKYQTTEEQLKDLEMRLNSMPKMEEMQTLQASLASSTSGVGQLQDSLKEKDETIRSKTSELQQLSEKLKEKERWLEEKESKLGEAKSDVTEQKKHVEDSRQKLSTAEMDVSRHKQDLARFEERSKLLQDQLKDTSSRLDKLQTEKTSLEVSMQSLEKEQVRLSKELDAGKLTLGLKEAELVEATEKLVAQQQQLERRESQLAERDRLLEQLEQKLGEARQTAQGSEYEKEQQITNLRAELDKNEARLTERDGALGDLQQQVINLQDHYQTECARAEKIQGQFRECDMALEEERRKAENREARITELGGQLSASKDNIARLEMERTDLIAKIEAGEGVTTAINQLKQESAVLQEKLSTQEGECQEQSRRHLEKVDDLHRQLQDTRSQLQAMEDAKEKLSEQLRSTQEKLEEGAAKVLQLETDVKGKTELLLTTEASKATQRADLENHIKTTQHSLEEKTNEVTKVKGQLEQLHQELADSEVKCSKLETSVKEQTERGNELQQRVVSLEADVKEGKATLERAEAGRETMRGELEERLAEELKRRTRTEASLEETKSKRDEAEGCVRRLEDVKVQLGEEVNNLKNNSNKLETDISKKSDDLSRLEQYSKTIEGQLKVAQATISEKTFQLEKTQGMLESEVAKLKEQHGKACTDATVVQGQLKQQIEKVELSRQQLEQDKGSLQKTLGGATAAAAALKLELEQSKARQDKTQVEATQAAEQASKHSMGLLDQVAALQRQLVSEKSTTADSTLVNKQLQAKVEELETLTKKKEGGISDLEKEVMTVTAKVKGMEDSAVKQVEESLKKEKQLQAELESANQKGAAIAQELKATGEQKSQVEQQLEILTRSKSDLETAHAAAQSNLQVSVDRVAQLSRQLEDNAEVTKGLTSKTAELETQLKDTTAQRDELKTHKGTLEAVLMEHQKAHQEVWEVKGALEKELEALKVKVEKDRVDRQKELEEHKEARDLLISQKLELQLQVTTFANTLASLRSEFDDRCEDATRVQKELTEKNEKLEKKVVHYAEAHGSAQKTSEEKEALYELQMSTLNENLSTIRTDFTTAQARLSDAERANNELKGEKLELEAKLENNNDERRALLERCLASEAEVVKLQEKVTEVRRKLDDTQAALHELGRENQTLQIITNKTASRKWTDDSQVTTCMSCNKGFSMTVRKHHCRNCGNIFCNECSMKSATVAASKKPVRVCDTCYADLVEKR